MIQWIKSIVGHVMPNVISQGAKEADDDKGFLIDVAEGAYLAEKAGEKGALLLGMIQKGGSEMAKLQMVYNVRKKVKKQISPAYENVPDIVDEITERVVEAALADPHYKKLFG
ncbi:MAG: hypothetical protein Q7S98_02520 [Deltaproteobacteria bacterium]|nr:hypothetical protein [Deltaproteobacteria bacterium]